MATDHTPRIHGLDTLRAVAILLVMVFHLQNLLPELLEPLASVGWMGVDLFFVLSGYLIGLQLLRPLLADKRPSLAEFYRRRAFRILPAYLVVLALYVWVPAWRESPGLSPAWEFLTFTENLFVDYSHNHAFSHVWSLCVEEHFYLILPILVLLLSHRPRFGLTLAVFLLFVALGLGLRTFALVHWLRSLPVEADHWYVLYYEHLYYPTWARLDGLIAGVALACVQLFRSAWWSGLCRRGHTLMLGGLGLFALAIWLFQDRNASDTGLAAWGDVVGPLVLSVALALVVLSALSRNGVLARWRVPGAGPLANLAFTLYLTHKAAAHLAERWLPDLMSGRDLKATAVCAVACLGIASLLHFAVERPFMILRTQIDRRDATPGMRVDPEL